MPHYGFKPGLNSCKDQDERGRWYRYVYENLYAHPNWVGTMYFHYLNQQLPGRNPELRRRSLAVRLGRCLRSAL